MAFPMTRARIGVLAVAAAVALAVVLIVVLQSGAQTAPREHAVESIFQDDDHLLYAPTPTVSSTLDTLASLGVQRLRLTILWSAIAPDPLASTAPAGFAATDPAAYPAASWVPYDRIVGLAAARHIGVDFDVTAPGPLWAMGGPSPVARYANHYEPSATQFGSFVAALGKRYDGSYTPPGASQPLPRVSFWSIWNEPNQPGWLAPQWTSSGGHPAMAAAAAYRALVDAAYKGLQATGHTPARDTILVGELAPEGTEGSAPTDPIPALTFLRGLYCVDAGYRPLRGAAAASIGCPGGGSSPGGGFAGAHPGLFQISGLAHHPYSFFLPPTASLPDPNFAPLSDLGRLEHALDSVFSAYGVSRKLPLYLTEYGYETNPPNPFRGVPPATQAAYIDQAQYMAWSDPRVRAMAQFELYDSAPDTSFPKGTIGYWSTFQTGLLYRDGTRKPSYQAYALPIVIPTPSFSSGGSVEVWGMLRLAPHGEAQRAEVQWASPGGVFRTLATVSTRDPDGVLETHVSPPGTGTIRLAWSSPAGATFYSRAVPVRES